MRLWVVSFAAVASCVAPTPKAALDDYVRALREGDVEAVYALSDDKFRESHSIERLRAHVETNPHALTARALALSAPEGAARQAARIDLPGGALVRLVFEAGAWKVASGGVALASFGTPKDALRTFFEAVDAGRLDEVRKVVPRRFLESFPDDEALRAHLESTRDRIDAAREAIRDDMPVEIDGQKAKLPYAPAKAVRFEREDGIWRIVDLE